MTKKLFYGKVTIEELTERFGIKMTYGGFLPNQYPTIQIPSWLPDIIEQGKKHLIVRTEKLTSEWLIGPILLALKQLNPDSIGVFSGITFNVGDFTGICDFMIKGESTPLSMESPIIALVEAKKLDIETGIPQCVAEMLAAEQFNSVKEKTFKQVYGCVTTADSCQFIKLENNLITIDPNTLYLNQLADILGAFQWMINNSKNA